MTCSAHVRVDNIAGTGMYISLAAAITKQITQPFFFPVAAPKVSEISQS